MPALSLYSDARTASPRLHLHCKSSSLTLWLVSSRWHRPAITAAGTAIAAEGACPEDSGEQGCLKKRTCSRDYARGYDLALR